MTLDEAIIHCHEKAKELRVEAEELRDIGEYTSSPKQPYNVPVNDCLECASEHEQLAEWLKDYKRLLEEQRPTGEWIDTGDMQEYWAEEYQCSICGGKDHWHNYCPNCGAKMKGGEEE